MKRFISFLTTFAVLLAVFPATTILASAQPGNFNVVVGSDQVHVHNPVYIPISLENVPAEGISNFEMTITEDTTTIDLKAIIGDGRLNPVITTVYPGTVTIKNPINKYTLKGYIKPDFSSKTSAVNSGFMINSIFSAVTDDNGYFEIKDVPPGKYYITISKTNYLTREIEAIIVDSDKELSTPENPILLWAGDINRDGLIYWSDLVALSSIYYNSIKGDSTYSEDLDFNLDGVINSEDLFIIAKHYYKKSSDY